jgi:hypothetical protein
MVQCNGSKTLEGDTANTLPSGFDALAPAKAVEAVQAFDAGIKIEEDQVVTTFENEN